MTRTGQFTSGILLMFCTRNKDSMNEGQNSDGTDGEITPAQRKRGTIPYRYQTKMCASQDTWPEARIGLSCEE